MHIGCKPLQRLRDTVIPESAFCGSAGCSFQPESHQTPAHRSAGFALSSVNFKPAVASLFHLSAGLSTWRLCCAASACDELDFIRESDSFRCPQNYFACCPVAYGMQATAITSCWTPKLQQARSLSDIQSWKLRESVYQQAPPSHSQELTLSVCTWNKVASLLKRQTCAATKRHQSLKAVDLHSHGTMCPIHLPASSALVWAPA